MTQHGREPGPLHLGDRLTGDHTQLCHHPVIGGLAPPLPLVSPGCQVPRGQYPLRANVCKYELSGTIGAVIQVMAFPK